MARRKTPRAARRRQVAKRGGTRGARRRSAVSASKKSAARKSSARPTRTRAPKQARLRKAATRPVSAVRKTAARTASAKRAHPRGATAARRKATRKSVVRASTKTARARKTAPRAATTRSTFVTRKAPSLDRERRIVRDDEVVPTPPSSLGLDRTASAARSGRRELHERLVEHTETGPAMTGGDIDADWESAYSVGDEAPGGDNPTPDQDIVDDIGRAVGVQYEDNEELKGEAKISNRDRKRWELDPASSEDYNDR